MEHVLVVQNIEIFRMSNFFKNPSLPLPIFFGPCKISKIFGESLWENVNFLDPCKQKFLERQDPILTLFLYGRVTLFDRFMMSSCNECFVKSFISLVIISDHGRKSVEATFQKTGFLKKKLEFWPDFIWENLAKIPTFF